MNMDYQGFIMNGLVWIALVLCFLGLCITLMVLGVTVAYAKPLAFLAILATTLGSMVVTPFLLAGYTKLQRKLSAQKKQSNDA